MAVTVSSSELDFISETLSNVKRISDWPPFAAWKISSFLERANYDGALESIAKYMCFGICINSDDRFATRT